MLPLRRCALLASTAALAFLAQPGSARAAVFPGEVVDGPTPELISAGDLDVARDGTGAVAYVKRVGDVPHVFVARLVNGAFLSPERIDPGLGGAASDPVVAATDGGRVAVAFTSNGQLNVALRPNGGSGFQPPQPIADGASRPSIDMSINGVSYVSFTAPGQSPADVRVARLARDATGFALLPDVLDIVPPRDAGDAARRSQVAVSADGTAVVVWGEADRVYARRVFGTRLSAAPQELNVPALDGHAGGGADLPDIDIEDDSSYAWAVFRQGFDDGRAHVVARRLVGSAFEAPVFVDGLGYPAPADATEPVIELNGRGEGIAATSGAGGVNAAILHEDIFNPGKPLGAGTPLSRPAVGIAENNDAFAAWLPGDGSVQIRPYDIDPARRLVPPPGPAAALSRPEFGPVVPAAGMDMAVNRVGDASAVFLQEGADGRRLVAGVFDRVPGAFRTFTTAKFRKFARPPLSWQASFDLLGAVKYRVEVDGQPVGETTDTKLIPLNPIGDGEHTWRVVAIDRRGQSAATPPRPLRVDATAPELSFRVTGSRKRGKPIKVAVTAADGSLATPGGSGIRTIRISWGDKTRVVSGRRATHRYARGGKYTIRVSATDVAGNAVALTKRITVKKK
ncbi:MAG: hypothetical protein AVDCRST_MAG53-3092 [uncultured Solirubrobacteraceae bacterium]|uniref:PKD domain-containing protein n=1 Tax=uncultured Solirubrobacteraceae bacterium TaxID=1162706 RepID=A0A6J4T820_9ACTN|nr:MAG: hypothetical protein AVDCRST_MAG53-3092 [uncultured Solirubrobacteraceae bacterium]